MALLATFQLHYCHWERDRDGVQRRGGSAESFGGLESRQRLAKVKARLGSRAVAG